MTAVVGPGSSKLDYEAVGLAFDERWERFDEVVPALRALLNGGRPPSGARHYPMPPELELSPAPRQEGGVPLWIGSWGSAAGLRRVARSADGWLASAYNTNPEGFAAARDGLASELADRGRDPEGFPNALATMWTWVTEDRADAERMLAEVLVPMLRRDPEELRAQVCVGSAEHCGELLSRYAAAGCERVYLWPLGDERRQLELVASEVMPRIGAD